MRLAWLALTLSASLVLDCSPVVGSPSTTTSTAQPSATERPVSASPTSASAVTGSPVVASTTPAPPPSRGLIAGLGSDVRVEVAGCLFPECLHWAIAAGRQVALVTTLRHRTETEFDSDLWLVDLTTGAQRLIRHGVAGLVPGRVGGPLLTYVESEPAPGGTFPRMTWRAYERNWRDGTERLLDETSAEVSPTGGWAPSPSPLTNGAQTVWLRPVQVSGQADRYELRLSDRGAPGRTIYTATNPFFFELDDRGRVAIGTVGSTAAELLLHDNGVVRSLARRQGASSASGWVGFSGGKIVWSVGWGSTGVNVTSIDLVDPTTGAATRVDKSPCNHAGSTPRFVAFACSDGGFLYDSINGSFTRFATYPPDTLGPDSFGLAASPEALWLPELREPAGRPNNSIRSWIVTPVVP